MNDDINFNIKNMFIINRKITEKKLEMLLILNLMW